MLLSLQSLSSLGGETLLREIGNGVSYVAENLQGVLTGPLKHRDSFSDSARLQE